MLQIKRSILLQLEHAFAVSSVEQGFILGCTSSPDRIEHCRLIPSVQAGKYYYVPNSNLANQIIQTWKQSGICFCGFIHSHIVEKSVLSEGDIAFAKKLFLSFHFPIWFGIGVIQNETPVDFLFYTVSGPSCTPTISPVYKFEII